MLYEIETKHPSHHEEEVVQEGPLGLIEGEEPEENESDDQYPLFGRYTTNGPNTKADAPSLPSYNWSTIGAEQTSLKRVSMEPEHKEPKEVLPKEDIKQDGEPPEGVGDSYKGEQDITRSKPPTLEPLGSRLDDMDEHGCQSTFQ